MRSPVKIKGVVKINSSQKFLPKTAEDFIKEIEAMVPDSSGKMGHTEEWYLMHEYNLTLEQLYWRKKTIANKKK